MPLHHSAGLLIPPCHKSEASNNSSARSIQGLSEQTCLGNLTSRSTHTREVILVDDQDFLCNVQPSHCNEQSNAEIRRHFSCPLMSSSIMDLLIQRLRQQAPTNVYIAQVDSLSYIDHPKGKWPFFKNLFCNMHAMEERDGFYCVPYYTGSATCGHWMMMIAHKQRQTVFAHFFDSMEAGSRRRQE